MSDAATNALLSPCTGVCELDRDGYCLGCRRTIGEIARWTSISDVERRWLMDEELPRRGLEESLS